MLSSETVSCGILIILCLTGISAAQLFDDDRDQGAELDDIHGVLRTVDALMLESDSDVDDDDDGGGGEKSEAPSVNAACRCGGDTCSCCQRITVKAIGLNENACLSATYLRREIGILVALKLGSRTIISQKASLSKMGQVCRGVPFLSKAASVCLQLKLSPGRGFVRGCATLVAKLLNRNVGRVSFGCFELKFVDGPDTGIGLPSGDGSHWIRTQRDSALPDLEDNYLAAVKKMEESSKKHFDNI